MTRYFRLFGHFLKISWMATMEYRINFLVWMLIDLGWSIMDIVSITSIAVYAGGLGHWTVGQVVFSTGVYKLLAIIVFGWLYESFGRIPALISEGELDMILSKPVDSQFMVSVGKFSTDMLLAPIVAMIYICVGAVMSNWQPDLAQILLGVWTLGISCVLVYALYFSTVACALFFGRLNNIHVLFSNLYGVSRFPSEIYPVLLQRFLTWIFPIALILMVPVDAFFGLTGWALVIRLHVLAAGFLILGRWLWHRGLRRYSSASS